MQAAFIFRQNPTETAMRSYKYYTPSRPKFNNEMTTFSNCNKIPNMHLETAEKCVIIMDVENNQ